MNLKVDSRKVKKGDTFIAINGALEDGHKYIEAAIKNGASKIVCEHGNYEVETIVVHNSKEYLNNEMKKYFDELMKDMTLIGITGTNGKTTTTFFIYEMLNLLGSKSAVLGTIGFYVEDMVLPTSNTTPGQIELYELFSEAKKRGCKNIAIELSSHGLYQDRINGLTLDAAAFTNLTQEHLDFHKTMEEYEKAKLKIFKFIKKGGFIVVNNDDKYSKDFCKGIFYTFGTKGKDLILNSVELYDEHSIIDFTYENKNYNVKLNAPCDFNVYNYLTAFLIVNKLGFSAQDIIDITKKLYLPAGRCERLKANGADIIIDYAHTPDAVERIIKTYKPLCKGKLITLTGCMGDRDRTKRPVMASIACKKSDYVILTHTNPMNEDFDHIKKDVMKGAKKNSEFITDRKEAIRKALGLLKKDDILLILGMGRKTFQIIKGEKIPHSDYDEVTKFKEEFKC